MSGSMGDNYLGELHESSAMDIINRTLGTSKGEERNKSV